ncbi:MAG: MFS transporter, partial [Candidatus Cryptobacteroides sp.]
MNDSPIARWSVLILVALMMFFAYMFVDVMSPLKSLVEDSLGWDSGVFGTYAASEYILNVCGFLIIAGVILDKLGVRFSGILSAGLMVLGAGIKFIGISDWFQTTQFAQWLGSWWVEMPASAKMASLGFMIFGCGCEMEGTNVSKILAKWFKGKEMALAMGLEMAIARIGVFGAMWISPMISSKFGGSVTAPLGFCGALLAVGLINFIIFGVMDRKFDKQLVAAGLATEEKSPEDEFHVKDLGAIFKSKMFWIVALLCVLYYSAIFPFQRYAPNFLEETLKISSDDASHMFSVFPILAMILTPVLGIFLDRIGKGASMLMTGSIIMIVCHLCFAFVLPIYPQKWLATALILILGVSFSLVPAALWPSVPKIIDEKILGSAYCL